MPLPFILHHHGRTAPTHSSRNYTNLREQEKKMLFLCQCVGYRQSLRGPLKCEWKRMQEHDTSLAVWASSRAIFGKSIPMNKGAWGQNQRTGSGVVCGEKVIPMMRYSLKAFAGAHSMKQQKRRPIPRRGQDKLYVFFISAYMVSCVIVSCLTEE